MGDKITVEQIEFIYGHLFQIDYYNETKDYHGRMFIDVNEIKTAFEIGTNVYEESDD